METDNKNERIKSCPECATNFVCCIEKCWCSELPMIMPLPDNAQCYCPECLKKIIQNKIEK